MSILSRAVLAAVLVVGSSLPSLAWSVLEGWREPIGRRTFTAVGTTNDAGMSVVLFRDVDGHVRAVFSLPASSFDRLPTEGRVLAYRSDERVAAEIRASNTPSAILEGARSDTRSVRLVIWYDLEPAPTVGVFRDLLDGDTLYARFFTDTGGTIDTSWPLEGARQAIADTLGITVYASPEAIEWSRLSGELLRSADVRCNQSLDCYRAMSTCNAMLRSRLDVDEFNLCVDRVAP